MGKLFGTDGARGIANRELTAELAMNIGRAAAAVLMEEGVSRPKVLIGKDTRLSSDMLASAAAAGLCSMGADVELLGVVPTPAVAYLVKLYGADAGIMISASHNPYQYNGIKIFDQNGYKFSDEREGRIEEKVFSAPGSFTLADEDKIGRCSEQKKARGDYVRYLASCVGQNLQGVRVAVDCANGSASATAKDLLESLGAACYFINDQPNGCNINHNCGSTHLSPLQETVVKYRCHLGVAFDGDADRCLVVDENGDSVDGDRLIAIFAKHMKQHGELPFDTAVVTVMTNIGFFEFAQNNGINVAVTGVGDRYVLEEMKEKGYALGGEQSGHIIFSEHMTTGDGQLTAIKLMEILKEDTLKVSKIAAIMERYPQVIMGVKAAADQKNICQTDTVLMEFLAECENKLAGNGRVLVRPSGTEDLIRVMVEGRSLDEISNMAIGISDKIKERMQATI